MSDNNRLVQELMDAGERARFRIEELKGGEFAFKQKPRPILRAERRCENCTWWDHLDDNEGMCCLSPPTMHVGGAQWTITHDADICSHHETEAEYDERKARCGRGSM